MYFLYSLLLGLAMVVASPYLLVRSFRRKHYLQSLIRRFGRGLPQVEHSRPPIWIHAVSVGEVLAAKPLVAALRNSRPDQPTIVSTVTVTGQALAAKEIATAFAIFYFPFDWIFCVRRFLDQFHPAAVIVMETELWPNFLRECSRRRIPVFLANGRISDKSSRRYRLVRVFARKMLDAFASIGVQTREDRRRFLELGAAEERVVVTGNLKFDLPAPSLAPHRELLNTITACLGIGPDTPVVVIGSTMKGEEAEILKQLQTLRSAVPGVRAILAPRHPERFAEVADLLQATGIPWSRRTAIPPGSPNSELLLLDTIGELRAVYALATAAVVGGSFLPYGGHNLLEPAALGKAIVFGPEMSNFRELAALFLREQAARQCSLERLASSLAEILKTPGACGLLGERAARIFRMNQGAAENTLKLILPRLP
jgi:3-deoxy-D-manno-octulosonic-acid transferase